MRQPIKPQVNNRRGIERQQLAYEQSADDRDSQWVPQLRASASPQRQWQSAQVRWIANCEMRPQSLESWCECYSEAQSLAPLDRWLSSPHPMKLRAPN